jgi:hypothetical protein
MKKLIVTFYFIFFFAANVFAQNDFIKIKAELIKYEEHYAWSTHDDEADIDYEAPAATFEIIEPKKYARLKKVTIIFQRATKDKDAKSAKEIVMSEIRKYYDLTTTNLWAPLKMPKGLIYSFDIPKDFFDSEKYGIYAEGIKNFKKEK